MSIFKENELSILWPFYLVVFICSFIYIINPIFIVYLASKGLSYTQVAIILAVWGLSTVLFEIPTGIIADIFGRKFSVLLSLILNVPLLILVPFINSFTHLLVLFILSGIITTFSSGADTAWMVDYIKKHKKPKLIKELFIKRYSIGACAFLLTGIVSYFILKKYSPDILWFFSAFVTFLAFLCYFFIHEDFKKRKLGIKKQFKNAIKIAKISLNYSFKHPVLLYLILAILFGTVSYNFSGVAFQPFKLEVGIPLRWFGLIASAGSALGIVIPFFTKKLVKKVKKEKYYLAIITFIDMIAVLIVYFIFTPFWAILIFLYFWNSSSLQTPVEEAFFQHHVKSKIRATISSLKNMIGSLGSSIGVIFGGIVLDKIGPRLTIVSSALILIPAIIFYLLIKDRK